MKHPFHIRYNNQADKWFDALPLGNGRLGAMVYGHTAIERIQLNDSLWYGKFIGRNNPSLRENCLIRQHFIRRHISCRGANNAVYGGTPACIRHYTLLGELDIALNQHLPFTAGWFPNGSAREYSCDLI